MCGIAGKISFDKDLRNDMETYRNVKNVLKNRGPDDSGIFTDENVSLIHTRLAVIDVENGKQPMKINYGNTAYIIVYNGELYNTDEIRNELISLGMDFNTHSDTEVVLKAYIIWKEKCLEKFNGIFAFAIWDAGEKRLFLARDRIGVKPLFFSDVKGEFIFSSEIKGILSFGVKAQADIKTVSEIVLIGPGRTQGCGVFKNVYEIPPAHYFIVDRNGMKKIRYWKLKDKKHEDDFQTTVMKVRHLVTDSIKRQLVSDVPVCTFLSGGLDSSLISSVADRFFEEKGEKLHTFSVDYRDNDKYFKPGKFQPNSDNEFIKIMAEYLNGEHHLVTIDTDELVSALYEAVDARDLPGMADVDASMLILCREIKKQGTVALSGECADEIFGGYPWYRDESIRAIDGFPWAQSTAYRYGFLKNDFAVKINPDEYVYSRYKNTVDDTEKREGLSKTDSRMKEMMKLNLDWFMQTLLDRKDRMSMYSGLEVRVPFCDYRIAEYLYNVPWEYKDYNHCEKGLLRKAMEGYLPDEVLWRKKSPYPKTHNPNYLKAVSDILKEIIHDASSPILSVLDKKSLEKILKSDVSVPWYGQLMTTPQTIAYFIQFNYWLEKYKVEII